MSESKKNGSSKARGKEKDGKKREGSTKKDGGKEKGKKSTKDLKASKTKESLEKKPSKLDIGDPKENSVGLEGKDNSNAGTAKGSIEQVKPATADLSPPKEPEKWSKDFNQIVALITAGFKDLANQYEKFLIDQLEDLNTNEKLKSKLQKSQNYHRLHEQLFRSGVTALTACYSEITASTSDYSRLFSIKADKSSKEFPLTTKEFSKTVNGIEIMIKKVFEKSVKEEQGKREKMFDVVSTEEYDIRRIEGSASKKRIDTKESLKLEEEKQLKREVKPGVVVQVFSTMGTTGQSASLPGEQLSSKQFDSYSESFDLHYSKDISLRGMDTVFAVAPPESLDSPLITMCGFNINSKGKVVSFDSSTNQIVKEQCSECTFDILAHDESLFIADWRIKKIVILKNKIVVGSADILFKDFYYKKSRLQS